MCQLNIARLVARLFIVGCLDGGESVHSHLIRNRLDDLLRSQQLF